MKTGSGIHQREGVWSKVDMGMLHGILMDCPAMMVPEVEAHEQHGHVKEFVNSWFEWEEHVENMRVKTVLRTPLQLAASMQSVQCVDMLLSAGSDPNSKSPSDGKTALHLACDCKPSLASARVIGLLVKHGADRSLPDAQGRLPGEGLGSSRMQAVGPSAEKRIDSQRDSSNCLVSLKSLQELDGCDYDSDHFRMYRFKIEACPHQNVPHDTAECPYLHPGERARRRNPKIYKYEAIPCPHFRKGNCKWGDACPLSHGVFECWMHPAKFRTQLCKEGASCTRSVCFFAHSIEQLRDPERGTSADTPGNESMKLFHNRSDDSPTCTLDCGLDSCGSRSGCSTPGSSFAEISSIFNQSHSRDKIFGLTEVAHEKAKVKQANAVFEAAEALKALAVTSQHVPDADRGIDQSVQENSFNFEGDYTGFLRSIPSNGSIQSSSGQSISEIWLR